MTQTTTYEDFPGNVGAQANSQTLLNKHLYTSEAVMCAEWQTVWTRSWLFAGLACDLEGVGDYFVYELGRESIVVTRNDDGAISAFYNVCQHRGNRLLSNESGCVSQLSCPYHGWTYALDGRLKKVPDAQRFSVDISAQQRSLKPVLVQEWAGLVWINMDPQAQPLHSYLGLIIDKLTPYQFEHMKLSAHQTVLLQANWKTAKDNFLEQYHVDFIHPQHANLVDCCNSHNTLWPYGHSATMVQGYTTDSRYPVPDRVPPHLVPMLKSLGLDARSFNGRVADIRKAVQQQKRLLGPELGFDYAQLSDAQVSDVWQYDIFPNLFFTIQAEELWIYGPRPHPTDPDQCLFDKWTLQLPVERITDADKGLSLNPLAQVSVDSQRPEHETFTPADVAAGTHSMTITLDQDIHYLADMQAGMHSRGFDHAVLNQDEARVQHFHDWLAQWMGDV